MFFTAIFEEVHKYMYIPDNVNSTIRTSSIVTVFQVHYFLKYSAFAILSLLLKRMKLSNKLKCTVFRPCFFFSICLNLPFLAREYILRWNVELCLSYTAQNMKFFIEDFLSKCYGIRRFWRIWSHLLKKSLMENFIFLCCAIYFLSFIFCRLK